MTGTSDPAPAPHDMALLLCDGGFDRLHGAFLLAASALAMGRDVVLFATGPAVMAFTRDETTLDHNGTDAVLEQRGVAGLTTLREAIIAMEATILVCESGLKRMAIEASALIPEARVAGMPTFLDHARGRDLMAF